MLLGHNVEYLLRLAEFMREFVPEGYDEHLLTLETLVRIRVKENNLCLKTLMGETRSARRPSSDSEFGGRANEERRDSFQFSAKVPSKKLRCLNL